MFNDPIECYQAIGSALATASKDPWDRIVLDATLDGVRVDTKVSCWREGVAEPVSYLTGVPRLASFIFDLAHLISTEERGVFKTCNFVLYKDVKFDVQFAY
jgi:hypothetical protein